MTPSLKSRILKVAEFETANSCGQWNIGIDDLDGELTHDRIARWVDVLEAEPVEKHLAQIKPLLEALACVAEELITKCMCWPENDSRAARNPCGVCLKLSKLESVLALAEGEK